MRLGILIGEAGLSTDGARAIQLALAPVFLLTGIAGLRNVMTARLGRIIDRGRHLTEAPRENLARRTPHLLGDCAPVRGSPVGTAAEVARRGTVHGRNRRLGRWSDLFSSRGAPRHPDLADRVEVCRN